MTIGRPLRVGTRGSALALRQADIVIGALRALEPTLELVIEIIRTAGDETASQNTAPLDGQGVFVRRIEQALLAGRIDIAVHSAKDMPTAATSGLEVAAYPPREDPRDALVTRGARLQELPPGATVGTGSVRRRALLLERRADLRVVPIRGNVDTRVRRAVGAELDGVVVALAGLRRLQLEGAASEILDPEVFVPAIAQGALAVQVRVEDEFTRGLVARLDDPATRTAMRAERAIAAAVGATCQTPVAGFARLVGDELRVAGFLVHEEAPRRASRTGRPGDAAELGRAVGMELLA